MSASASSASSLLRSGPVASTRLVIWVVLIAVPMVGFGLLLAAPEADVRWEHHPSHFWLVLASAVTSAGLAFATSAVARRRGDARIYLVSNGVRGCFSLEPSSPCRCTPWPGSATW